MYFLVFFFLFFLQNFQHRLFLPVPLPTYSVFNPEVRLFVLVVCDLAKGKSFGRTLQTEGAFLRQPISYSMTAI